MKCLNQNSNFWFEYQKLKNSFTAIQNVHSVNRKAKILWIKWEDERKNTLISKIYSEYQPEKKIFFPHFRVKPEM